MLLEEKFRKFNFSVTLTQVKCSVATWDLTWWAVQVREGFLEEAWELGLEGWQTGESALRQGNSISKAWVQGGPGLLRRKSGCQEGKAQDFHFIFLASPLHHPRTQVFCFSRGEGGRCQKEA